MTPLIPLVGVVFLLLVLGTAVIFLPPYLLAMRTSRSKTKTKRFEKNFILIDFVFSLAIDCIPGCWNGGSCSAKNICTCVTGFRGDRCEQRKINFSSLIQEAGAMSYLIKTIEESLC